MNQYHLSSGSEGPGVEEHEFYRRRKIASCLNRRKFLRSCLEEKVLPGSAPKQLRSDTTPFTESAAAYLEESCVYLTNRIYELTEGQQDIVLSRSVTRELESEDSVQKERLRRKLKYLCDNSKWSAVGRPDIILNLSDKQLTRYEEEVLSLGLKFDTGVDRKCYAEYVNKNYKWSDSDVDKGFAQGVIACYKALASENSSVLPLRHRKALDSLSKDQDIIITQADKGGGVIIMNKSEYVQKMETLLSDGNTYEKKNTGYTEGENNKFNSEVRKVLVKTERGKKLLSLIEECPRPPRMRGLPKIHKPGIPMRPITSGIGSAPHRLAKKLAKPLSSALGTISEAHLKNSTDLIDRLKTIDFSNKKLASFDVKSLFTNVPVEGALRAVERALDNVREEDLPVRRCDYMKLVNLCVKFGAFSFNGEEYRQHRGLAMGSPLSAVMASLYMETLEVDHYSRIIGRGSVWCRYVDDVLVIVPKNTNIHNKLRMLNEVCEDIQFTIEEEEDNKLPFLDTVIWRTERGVRFSVYRKPTNKDDFIHYLSAHSDRTKSGVIIGFFLRAMRICSEDYLDDEYKYIINAFKKLSYPEGWILKLKRKAREIMDRSRNNGNTTTVSKTYMTLPNSRNASTLDKYLARMGTKTATSSGVKIGEATKTRQEKKTNKDSVIYGIPCNSCSSIYIGETGRGLAKRLYEHKADVRHHRTSNSIVLHIDRFQHLPKWENTFIIQEGLDKKMRKTMEAAHICSNNDVINHREGFLCWAKTAASIAVSEIKSQSGTRNGVTRRADVEVTGCGGARPGTADINQSGATVRRRPAR